MPNFNIELRTQDRVWETLSVENSDPDALRLEMARFVGDLLKEHAGQIWLDQEWRVDVTDESGLIMFIMQIQVTDSPAASPMRR